MTKQNNLYVDINVLQTVPSSNINRDDAGAPKTAIYGGVTRARVSSQSWKHAIRMAFKEDSEDADWLLGHRTKKGVTLLAQRISAKDSSLSEEEALDKAANIFKMIGIKISSKKGAENQTAALAMISNGQLDKLADYALSHDEFDAKDKKELKKLKDVFNENDSLDLALFGRMMADDPELNVDAASQVAHAISTHEVVPEFDYFTALDDEKDKDTSGAAMIETFGYNSSTLYRYANVNVNELIHNLGSTELAIKGIELFIKEFVDSMPTGAQNRFANKTVPQYVMVTIRPDTPVNLVSAFESPVKSRDGYVEKSIARLEAEFENTQRFVEKPLFTTVMTTKQTELPVENQANMSALLNQVAEALNKEVENESISD